VITWFKGAVLPCQQDISEIDLNCDFSYYLLLLLVLSLVNTVVTTYCNDMICDCSFQLKVDMVKLIEVFGASESGFSSVIVVKESPMCVAFIRFVSDINEM